MTRIAERPHARSRLLVEDPPDDDPDLDFITCHDIVAPTGEQRRKIQARDLRRFLIATGSDRRTSIVPTNVATTNSTLRNSTPGA